MLLLGTSWWLSRVSRQAPSTSEACFTRATCLASAGGRVLIAFFRRGGFEWTGVPLQHFPYGTAPDPHITAPGQDTSDTGLLELGPQILIVRLWWFQEPLGHILYPYDPNGLPIFSLAGFFIFAYTSSYAPAHSFPVDRHGVPSTLHIVFFNCWYLSLDHREIEAIPSLPSTRPVHSLPSPHHLT